MDISSRGMQPIDASEKATETPKKEPLGIFRTRYLMEKIVRFIDG